MTNQQQIKQAAAQLYLDLDNPQSVKKQLERVNEAQKQLRQLKQQVNSKLQEFNQANQNNQKFGLDEAASIGLHIFGQHRIANQVRRQGNMAERKENNQEQRAKQPHIKMGELIDNYIFEGDRLKTMAQNYLLEHK